MQRLEPAVLRGMGARDERTPARAAASAGNMLASQGVAARPAASAGNMLASQGVPARPAASAGNMLASQGVPARPAASAGTLSAPEDVSELHADAAGAQPAVRYDGIQALAARYAANRSIIESMLDETTRPAERDQIVRDLGVLPTGLLRQARDAGVKIYVTRPGEKGPPPRLLHAGEDPDAPVGPDGLRLPLEARQSLDDLCRHYPNTPQVDGVFNAGFGLLLVNQDALPDPSPLGGHYRTILHEFGHVTWMLRRAGNPDFQSEMDRVECQDRAEEMQLRQSTTPGPGQSVDDIENARSPFVSAYAMDNEQEHYAEGFESYWTEPRNDGVPRRTWGAGGRENLEHRDPDLYRLISEDMQAFTLDDARGKAP